MQSLIIDKRDLKEKIYTIRAVKRNIGRFPDDFRFQLSDEEFSNWRSQIVTSNGDKMGLRYSPYAFTEQGISMLSTILKSDIAVDISVKIMRIFVQMRQVISENNLFFKRLKLLETKQEQTDENVHQILDALENKTLAPKQGIFFEGEVFDAYVFINDLMKSANRSLVIFDNYIDESVLTLFSKYSAIDITVYTQVISKQLKLDFEKYNMQYTNVKLETFKKSHDRFLIIDDKEVYHIGASLKDLGKKWFAFSKMDTDSLTVLEKVGR